MKVISVVFLCFFILACSSTKVHLYTRYLSPQEVKTITVNLEEKGFDVINNTLVFPDGIEQSTLLYSPFVEGEDTVNILIESLEQKGWLISSVQPIVAGNHYYTKNSLGLLLLPAGISPSAKMTEADLANDYQSKACQSSMTLSLNSDASYQFSFTDKLTHQNEQSQGSWQITSYPYIELISSGKNRRFYYQIEKSIVTDVVGKAEIIELKPIDDHYTLPKCTFHYGLRL